MPEKWLDLLHRRVSELDGDAFYRPPDEQDRDLLQFVWVMSAYVPNSMGHAGEAVIAAAAADAVMARSQLMTRLAQQASDLTDGPVSRKHQHWAVAAHPIRTPSPLELRDPKLASVRQRTSLNPVEVGAFTSTPGPAGNSMWEIYLHLLPRGLAPTHVWTLELLDDPVLEIDSAIEWVRLADRYGREVDGMIRPDWSEVAEDYAGVHLAARAVAAIQGFSFETAAGLTAPAFWDVEQTLWFRWAFRSVAGLT